MSVASVKSEPADIQKLLYSFAKDLSKNKRIVKVTWLALSRVESSATQTLYQDSTFTVSIGVLLGRNLKRKKKIGKYV